mgnify:FL=1
MAYVHCPALRCPIDGSPLVLHGSSLGCQQHHSFDLAKQGYVNLLLNHDKRSNDPGDSKAMVAARRAFLGLGLYEPILERICDLVVPKLIPAGLVVEAGCGEGYYLEGLWRRAVTNGIDTVAVGFDISKWAVSVAAKRFSATWLVATNRRIPLCSASSDVILDIFGFACADEFARVLKPGGLWLRVGAGADHLLALRKLVYPEVPERSVVPTENHSFTLLGTHRLQFALPTLAQPAIDHLFMMTPHYFRAPAEGRAQLAACDRLDVSADVVFEVLERR